MPPGTAGSGHAPASLPSVHTAGVDWLTATSHANDCRTLVLRYAGAIAERERARGQDVRGWRWKGYEGWSLPGLAFGNRPDSAIVRLSGALAHRHWPAVFARSERCTRLDGEVTLAGLPAGLDLAAVARAEADAYRPDRGRPPKWTYIQTKQDGATCYLGSRASTRYARLYDKGAEEGEGHLRGKWRYEVEWKGERASLAAAALSNSPDATAVLIALVHAHFVDRGVTPRFQPAGAPPATTPAPDPSDVERKLKWLERNVRLTVEWLRARGYEAEVREALDLPSDAGRQGTSGTEGDGYWQSLSPRSRVWMPSPSASES